VVDPWVKELDLKVQKPEPKDDQKEPPPAGSSAGSGAGAGAPQTPKFKSGAEMDKWLEENEKTGKPGGKWRP
jgi:hypothetical protein